MFCTPLSDCTMWFPLETYALVISHDNIPWVCMLTFIFSHALCCDRVASQRCWFLKQIYSSCVVTANVDIKQVTCVTSMLLQTIEHSHSEGIHLGMHCDHVEAEPV